MGRLILDMSLRRNNFGALKEHDRIAHVVFLFVLMISVSFAARTPAHARITSTIATDSAAILEWENVGGDITEVLKFQVQCRTNAGTWDTLAATKAVARKQGIDPNTRTVVEDLDADEDYNCRVNTYTEQGLTYGYDEPAALFTTEAAQTTRLPPIEIKTIETSDADGFAVIEWAQRIGNDDTESYFVEWKSSLSDTWADNSCVDLDSTMDWYPLMLGGDAAPLTDGEAWHVRVSSCQAACGGCGTPSYVHRVNPFEDNQAPDAVAPPTLTPAADGGAGVVAAKWKEPHSGGSAITQYTVSCDGGAHTTTTTELFANVDTGATTTDIDCMVIASNANGDTDGEVAATGAFAATDLPSTTITAVVDDANPTTDIEVEFSPAVADVEVSFIPINPQESWDSVIGLFTSDAPDGALDGGYTVATNCGASPCTVSHADILPGRTYALMFAVDDGGTASDMFGPIFVTMDPDEPGDTGDPGNWNPCGASGGAMDADFFYTTNTDIFIEWPDADGHGYDIESYTTTCTQVAALGQSKSYISTAPSALLTGFEYIFEDPTHYGGDYTCDLTVTTAGGSVTASYTVNIPDLDEEIDADNVVAPAKVPRPFTDDTTPAPTATSVTVRWVGTTAVDGLVLRGYEVEIVKIAEDTDEPNVSIYTEDISINGLEIQSLDNSDGDYTEFTTNADHGLEVGDIIFIENFDYTHTPPPSIVNRAAGHVVTEVDTTTTFKLGFLASGTSLDNPGEIVVTLRPSNTEVDVAVSQIETSTAGVEPVFVTEDEHGLRTGDVVLIVDHVMDEEADEAIVTSDDGIEIEVIDETSFKALNVETVGDGEGGSVLQVLRVQLEVTGLEPDTEYRFTTKALSFYLDTELQSEESDAFVVRTASAELPSAPTMADDESEAADSSIFIAWTAGDSGGREIEKYRVECSTSNQFDEPDAPDWVTFYTVDSLPDNYVTGLAADTEHFCRVRAVNGLWLLSENSDVITITTTDTGETMVMKMRTPQITYGRDQYSVHVVWDPSDQGTNFGWHIDGPEIDNEVTDISSDGGTYNTITVTTDHNLEVGDRVRLSGTGDDTIDRYEGHEVLVVDSATEFSIADTGHTCSPAGACGDLKFPAIQRVEATYFEVDGADPWKPAFPINSWVTADDFTNNWVPARFGAYVLRANTYYDTRWRTVVQWEDGTETNSEYGPIARFLTAPDLSGAVINPRIQDSTENAFLISWSPPEELNGAAAVLQYSIECDDDRAFGSPVLQTAFLDTDIYIGGTGFGGAQELRKGQLYFCRIVINTEGGTARTFTIFDDRTDGVSTPIASSSCADGLQTTLTGERDVDCGGPCVPCNCVMDAIQNADEEGVNCGGSCPIPCFCQDGIQSGDEYDVDCGGSCPNFGPEDGDPSPVCKYLVDSPDNTVDPVISSSFYPCNDPETYITVCGPPIQLRRPIVIEEYVTPTRLAITWLEICEGCFRGQDIYEADAGNGYVVAFKKADDDDTSWTEVTLLVDPGFENDLYEVREGEDFFFIATGLDANTRYDFKVGAFNTYGMGKYSEEIVIKTLFATPPNRPEKLEIDHETRFGFHLTWDEPFSNGDPVTKYIIVCSEDTSIDEDDHYVTAIGMSETTLTGLQGETDYYCRVEAAFNSVGRSSPAAVLTRHSTGKRWLDGVGEGLSGAPLKMTPPTLVENTATEIVVEWDELILDEITPIRAWMLEMDSDSDFGDPVEVVIWNRDDVEREYEFTGLEIGTTYYFRISAKNKFSEFETDKGTSPCDPSPWSPVSSSLEVTTDSEGPPLWNTPEIFSVSPDSAIVKWEKPTFQGYVLSSPHEVQCFENNGLVDIIDMSATGSPTTITTRSEHGLSVGDYAYIEDHQGSDGDRFLNQVHLVTAVPSDTEFEIDIFIEIPGPFRSECHSSCPFASQGCTAHTDCYSSSIVECNGETITPCAISGNGKVAKALTGRWQGDSLGWSGPEVKSTFTGLDRVVIATISSDAETTITTEAEHMLTAGDRVVLRDCPVSALSREQGFIVTSVPTDNSFVITFDGESSCTSNCGRVEAPDYIYSVVEGLTDSTVYRCRIRSTYRGKELVSTASTADNPTEITVEGHGLRPNDMIYVKSGADEQWAIGVVFKSRKIFTLAVENACAGAACDEIRLIQWNYSPDLVFATANTADKTPLSPVFMLDCLIDADGDGEPDDNNDDGIADMDPDGDGIPDCVQSDADEHTALIAFTIDPPPGSNADDSYLISYESEDGSHVVSSAPSTANVIIDSLITGTKYTVSVQGRSAEDTDAISPEVVALTIETTPSVSPETMEPPTIVDATESAIFVVWEQAVSPGEDITEYEVQCNDESDFSGSQLTSRLDTENNRAIVTGDTYNAGDTNYGGNAMSGIPVAGLESGASFFCKVKATNSQGSSEWSAPSAEGVTLTAAAEPMRMFPPELGECSTGDPYPALSPSEIKIAWRELINGFEGASPVLGYRVSFYKQSEDESLMKEVDQEDESSTEIFITGLEGGVTYVFRVLAYNFEGEGEWSEGAELTTLPAGKPDVPWVEVSGAEIPRVDIVHAVRSAVHVEWVEVAGNGSPVEQTVVECRDASNGEAVAGETYEYPYLGTKDFGAVAPGGGVSGIDVSSVYCRGRLRNEMGWSAVPSATYEAGSQRSLATTQGHPLRMDRPEVIDLTKDSITIRWTFPADVDGSPLRDTQVRFTSESDEPPDAEDGIWFEDASVTQYTLTGLRAETTYNIWLYSKNRFEFESGFDEWSEASAMLPVTTLNPGYRGRPDTMSRPILLSATHDALMLQWDKLQEFAVPITRYEVECAQEEEGLDDPIMELICASEEECDDAESPQHLTDLTPETEYFCRMRAYNSKGDRPGEVSVAMATDAIHVPPLMMYQPSLDGSPTQTSVTVEWDEPISEGGDVVDSYTIRYKKTVTVGDFWTPLEIDCEGGSCTRNQEITDLLGNTEYAIQIVATNTNGQGSSFSTSLIVSTSPMLPSTLSEPILIDVTDTVVLLGWEEAESRGSEILRYEAQCTSIQDNWSAPTTTDATLDTEATVGFLAPDTPVWCRVVAFNSEGVSEGVAWSNANRPLSLGVERAPLRMPPPHEVEHKTSHLSLTIDYSLTNGQKFNNGIGGTNVDGYDLEMREVQCNPYPFGYLILCNETFSDPVFVTKDADTSTHTFDGLRGGTTYQFTVRAYTQDISGARREGEWSTPANITTRYSTMADTPRVPTLEDKTNTALYLSWDDDDFFDNGDPVTKFIIECLEEVDAGADTKIFRSDVDGFPALMMGAMTGLEPETGYKCRLYAQNSHGTSAFSEWVEGLTTEKDDATPFALQPDPPLLMSKNSTYIKVNFTLPADNAGAEVQTLRLHWAKAGDAKEEVLFDVADTLEFEATGLLGLTEYEFEVEAFNYAGWSQISEVLSVTTELAQRPGLPGDPQLVDTTNTALMLEWDGAEWSGDPITKYEIHCAEEVEELAKDDGLWLSSIVDTLTDSGSAVTRWYILSLETAKTYQCRIRAFYGVNGFWVDGGANSFETDSGQGPPLVTFTPSVVDATSTTVTISADEPVNDGGAEVSRFRVQYRPAGFVVCTSETGVDDQSGRRSNCEDVDSDVFDWENTDFDSDGTSMTVTGLDVNSPYEFRVAAGNSVGFSTVYSPSIEHRTTQKEPSPVNAPFVLDSAQTALFLGWDEPVDADGSITRYVIVCASNVTTHAKDVTATTLVRVEDESEPVSVLRTEHSIEGLSSNTTYRCFIEAYNTVGGSQGELSEDFSTTAEPGRPLMMLSPTYDPDDVTSSKVFLTWEAPNNNNFVILGYQIMWRVEADLVENSDNEFNLVDITTPVQEHLMEGLRKGMTHEIRIRADNGGTRDYSIESLPVFIKTSSSLPEAPAKPCALVINHSFITVAFSLLDTLNSTTCESSGIRIDNGRDALAWELKVELETGDDQFVTWEGNYAIGVIDFFYSLTNVPVFSELGFSVRAKNIHGWGPYSETLFVSTTGPEPAMPTIAVLQGKAFRDEDVDNRFDPYLNMVIQPSGDSGGMPISGFDICIQVLSPNVYRNELLSTFGGYSNDEEESFCWTVDDPIDDDDETIPAIELNLDGTVLDPPDADQRSLIFSEICLFDTTSSLTSCQDICQSVTLNVKVATRNEFLIGDFSEWSQVEMPTWIPSLEIHEITDTIVVFRLPVEQRVPTCGRVVEEITFSPVEILNNGDISDTSIARVVHPLVAIDDPNEPEDFRVDGLSQLTFYKVDVIVKDVEAFQSELDSFLIGTQAEVVSEDDQEEVMEISMTIENGELDTFDAEEFLKQLADEIGISYNRIKIVSIEPGSVVLTFEIQEAPAESSLDEVKLTLSESLESGAVTEATGFRISNPKLTIKEANPAPKAVIDVPTDSSGRMGTCYLAIVICAVAAIVF